MRRFGQYAELKPEMVEEYKKLHANVWPEIRQLIYDCNLRNYSIYISGNRVFSYFEYVGDDFDADMERMAADKRNQEWWAHTHPCFVGHEKDEYYLDWEEIFYQD